MSSNTNSSSTSEVPVVFITSATGTQGLNLATLLRDPSHNLNWTVRATTRNLSSPAAHKLISLGVQLFQASWDDTAVLTTALSTCTHLFLNTITSFTDPLLERQQTSQILSLAKQTGSIKHVIFSSSLVVNRLDELTIFNTFPLSKETILGSSLYSKQATENTLKNTGFQYWTILRGASFMENYLDPKVQFYGEDIKAHRIWRMALKREDKLPLVDTFDIARFAVRAFKQPGLFNGREIEIAGEVLEIQDIARQLSDVILDVEIEKERQRGIEKEKGVGEGDKGDGEEKEGWRDDIKGKKLEYIPLSEEEIEDAKKRGDQLVIVQLCLRELVKFVDVEEVKKWGVEVGTFGEFLEREREAVKKTFCLV